VGSLSPERERSLLVDACFDARLYRKAERLQTCGSIVPGERFCHDRLCPTCRRLYQKNQRAKIHEARKALGPTSFALTVKTHSAEAKSAMHRHKEAFKEFRRHLPFPLIWCRHL